MPRLSVAATRRRVTRFSSHALVCCNIRDRSRPGSSMLDVYKKLYRLLDARERRPAALVVCLLLAVAFVENLGVAFVKPFIAVLVKPELIQTNAYLVTACSKQGFSSVDSYPVFMGVAFSPNSRGLACGQGGWFAGTA